MLRDRLRVLFHLTLMPGADMAWLCALFDALAATGVSVEELDTASYADLVDRFGFTADQAVAFLRGDARMELGIFPDEGLHLLTRADAAWPLNLLMDNARQATPWLFMLGNPALLEVPAIGIAGSRDATPRSLEIARALASEVVRAGHAVVSGGARGVDSAAHDAALAARGRTVVVLAQGIGTYRPPWRWREPLREGRLAVFSEYMPMDEWEAYRAIRRNGTIVQLSRSFVVVQADETGGTVSAGRAALKMRWPLHVVLQEGAGAERFAGNDLLIRLGGAPLFVPPGPRLPDRALDQLLSPPDPPTPPSASPTQLELFA